jgi:hypothetical protein
MASGSPLRTVSRQAIATGLRKLISSTRKPPAQRARAKGSACAMSVTTSSGMTRTVPTMSRMFIGIGHCAIA